jgi:hypothetical protein
LRFSGRVGGEEAAGTRRFPETPRMITNRRQHHRERVYQTACLTFNGDQSVFACTIRNVSETGALVRLADWTELPRSFALARAGAAPVMVRQCWRRGDDVGIAYLDPAQHEPEPPIDLAAWRAARGRR